jgi:hypothetical protein
MTRSTNTFSNYSFSSSSNTDSDVSLSSGSNLFARVINNASLNGWDGDNVSSDYFAQYGDYEGSYFGQGSFGGIRHFNK